MIATGLGIVIKRFPFLVPCSNKQIGNTASACLGSLVFDSAFWMGRTHQRLEPPRSDIHFISSLTGKEVTKEICDPNYWVGPSLICASGADIVLV